MLWTFFFTNSVSSTARPINIGTRTAFSSLCLYAPPPWLTFYLHTVRATKEGYQTSQWPDLNLSELKNWRENAPKTSRSLCHRGRKPTSADAAVCCKRFQNQVLRSESLIHHCVVCLVTLGPLTSGRREPTPDLDLNTLRWKGWKSAVKTCIMMVYRANEPRMCRCLNSYDITTVPIISHAVFCLYELISTPHFILQSKV